MRINLSWTSFGSYVVVFFVLQTQVYLAYCSTMKYCPWEKFNPQCRENEIVWIESALYGRMRLGKCISATFGYLGCMADVRGTIGRKCFGMKECNVAVARSLVDEPPCPTDVTMYLEVAYSCLEVVEANPSCTVHLSPDSSARIPSLVNNHASCGSPTRPWIVKSESAVLINVSIIDSGIKNLNESKHCGAIYDRRNKMNVKLYDFSVSEEEQIQKEYKFLTDDLEVVLYPNSDCIFLLKLSGAVIQNESKRILNTSTSEESTALSATEYDSGAESKRNQLSVILGLLAVFLLMQSTNLL